MDKQSCLRTPPLLPLIKAVCHNQAAPFPKGILESSLLSQRLGSRVNEPTADRRVRGPPRHQSPAHGAQLPCSVIENDRDVVSRCYVEAGRRVIGDLIDSKLAGED